MLWQYTYAFAQCRGTQGTGGNEVHTNAESKGARRLARGALPIGVGALLVLAATAAPATRHQDPGSVGYAALALSGNAAEEPDFLCGTTSIVAPHLQPGSARPYPVRMADDSIPDVHPLWYTQSPSR